MYQKYRVVIYCIMKKMINSKSEKSIIVLTQVYMKTLLRKYANHTP